MLTDEELAAIRARERGATRGPWVWDEYGDLEGNIRILTRCGHCPDDILSFGEYETIPSRVELDFITHAREDVPRLLDDVDELLSEVRRLREENGRMRDGIYRIIHVMHELGRVHGGNYQRARGVLDLGGELSEDAIRRMRDAEANDDD